MHEVYTEFALLLAVSALLGIASTRLRQPLLIAYIVVGIVAGPSVLGLVAAQDHVDLLARVGVAVLLFLVGLKLDLQHVRHIGPVALATGLGQLSFTIVAGFLLMTALGMGFLKSLYVAVALTFSSTIIIVKLLTDKREIDSLHGRIAVGFLIVQDLAVVVAMMAMSALRGGGGEGAAAVAASLAWRVALAGASLYVLMRHVLPRLSVAMARSQELLLVFAVAWGTGLAALGEWAGFSKEAGAFLAGFSLASTDYRDAIASRLAGLRDFLLLFFFLDLGANLDLSALGAEAGAAALLSAFVLVGNPLIVMAIMGAMGYRRRTGFLAGLTVAQISEFSIVFVAMGVSLGHVGTDALGLTTLVGLVTIAASTYLILNSHPLYERLAPYLAPFERKDPFREPSPGGEGLPLSGPDVVLFGLGRFGGRFARGLVRSGHRVLGVDFDPEVCRELAAEGVPVRYGDCTESELLEGLPLRSAPRVVCALPDASGNRALLQALRLHGYRGEVTVVVREEADGEGLAELGAARVLNPLLAGIDRAVELLAGEAAPPGTGRGSPPGAEDR